VSQRPEGDVGAEEGPPGIKHPRTVFFAVTALAIVAILFLARGVLLPFLLAILVAYVLFPLVAWVEKRSIGKHHVPRWAAILLVYIVMIGSMVGSAIVVIPRLFEETKQLSTELPKLTQRFRDVWLPALDHRLQKWAGDTAAPKAGAAADSTVETPPIVIKPRDDGSFEVHVDRQVEIRKRDDNSWVVGPRERKRKGFSSALALQDGFDRTIAYVQKNSLELLKIGRTIVASVSRGVFYFFITLMLAGYMMFTYERIHSFARETWPEERRRALDRFLYRVDRGLSGVVRGQLIICLVNGVLSAIGFWIFDLKYWPILSVIAAVMSIIPIFGSILSTIPAVAIGLTQSFGTAMGVLVWVVAIHQLEANFLNPKIIGDQAKIHPVLVVFALLVGEHLYQIPGALLAVPVLAVVQAVFMHFRESVLGLPASRISRSSLMPPGVITAAGTVRVSSSAMNTPLVTTRRSPLDESGASIDIDVDAVPDTDNEAKTRSREATEKAKRAVSTTLRSELE
jgi:predicted PurR-regulated permease PerM